MPQLRTRPFTEGPITKSSLRHRLNLCLPCSVHPAEQGTEFERNAVEKKTGRRESILALGSCILQDIAQYRCNGIMYDDRASVAGPSSFPSLRPFWPVLATSEDNQGQPGHSSTLLDNESQRVNRYTMDGKKDSAFRFGDSRK